MQTIPYEECIAWGIKGNSLVPVGKKKERLEDISPDIYENATIADTDLENRHKIGEVLSDEGLSWCNIYF